MDWGIDIPLSYCNFYQFETFFNKLVKTASLWQYSGLKKICTFTCASNYKFYSRHSGAQK